MVTPQYEVKVNGKSETTNLKDKLLNLVIKDETANFSDELILKIKGKYERVKYGDIIEVSIFYKEDTNVLTCGSFYVQSTTRFNDQTLIIHATSTNFLESLKERRSKSYKQLSLAQLCSMLANRHGLTFKSDVGDIFIEHIDQTNESDLNLLLRLAKQYNLVFNMKEKFLMLLKHEQALEYTVDAKEVEHLRIKHMNKTQYKSCKAVWHDMKENLSKEVIVGSGEPCFKIESYFQSPTEAKNIATAKFEQLNQDTIKGHIFAHGLNVHAGGKLKLTNSFEDDASYYINRVEHALDGRGWRTEIEFSK